MHICMEYAHEDFPLLIGLSNSVMDCRELAETILDSGDTLLTILGDILDFSKIDHNSMVLESAPVTSQTPQ